MQVPFLPDNPARPTEESRGWENGLPPDTIKSLRYDLEGQAQRAEYWQARAQRLEAVLRGLLDSTPILAMEDDHPFGIAFQSAVDLIEEFRQEEEDSMPF